MPSVEFQNNEETVGEMCKAFLKVAEILASIIYWASGLMVEAVLKIRQSVDNAMGCSAGSSFVEPFQNSEKSLDSTINLQMEC